MSDRSLLVTCGLPYTNGPCHLGHLRTYVPADFYVRYLRRSGKSVVFVCGSDNHGTPIVVSAEEEGVTPRALSERYHEHFDQTFQRMGVEFDHFGMTDNPANHWRTRSIVERLIKNGHVYSKVIQQSYCAPPACYGRYRTSSGRTASLGCGGCPGSPRSTISPVRDSRR